jgi:hypothetical protein
MAEELLKGVNISLNSSLLVAVAFPVFAAGLFDFARKKSSVVYLLVVPVLVGIIVIIGMGSGLAPRLFFFAIGFAVIVVIRGLTICGDLMSRALHLDPVKAPLVGVGLCVTVIVISATSVSRAYLPKQDYTGAIEFVQEKRRPGDIVVTVGLAGFPYQRFYKVDWEQVATLEELNEVRSRKGRTWLVYTMPIVLNSEHPEIMKSIQIDFEEVREFPGTLNGGNIVVALAKS